MNRGISNECSAIANSAFGTNVFTSDLDPALRSGWGVRPGDWGFGASVQQEILPRVSVELGYNRRWLNNFTWDDNVLQATGDFKSVHGRGADGLPSGRCEWPDQQPSL